MDNSPHGPILHQWSFEEFEHHHHSIIWRIGATLLLGSGIGFALWQHNITLAFLLVSVGVVLVAREFQGPETMRVRIREGALELLFEDHHNEGREPTTVIPWDQFRHFWMIYQPPDVRHMYFHYTSAVKPRLRIPLAEENPVEIRETLRRFLEEDLQHTNEPITDALARVFKI